MILVTLLETGTSLMVMLTVGVFELLRCRGNIKKGKSLVAVCLCCLLLLLLMISSASNYSLQDLQAQDRGHHIGQHLLLEQFALYSKEASMQASMTLHLLGMRLHHHIRLNNSKSAAATYSTAIVVRHQSSIPPNVVLEW
jgi:hypothetical protein